jgi:hypothetical protein
MGANNTTRTGFLRAGGGGVAAAPASESGPGAGVTVMLLMSWAEGEAGREKGGDERFVSEDEGSDERRAPDGSWSRLADMVLMDGDVDVGR